LEWIALHSRQRHKFNLACCLPYDVCAITIRSFDSVQHGHAIRR
jgi:hypothetical protein